MRESFGGAFMIKLALVFLIVYVTFMAMAINYAKAFRVKNGIINIIEQNQYVGTDDDINKIDDYLITVGYNYGSEQTLRDHCRGLDPQKAIFTERGACIISEGEPNKPYYRVISYIHLKLPFFGFSMMFPISGETKVIR